MSGKSIVRFDHVARPPAGQRGMTLAVGLIMLLVLTLFALAAMRLSTSSLRTVGNMQITSEAASAAQTAIEQVLSSTTAFTAPASQTITVPVNRTDFSVAVAAPVCIRAVPISGNSFNNQALALQDTYWDVQATATDTQSGASVVIHQGVRVRLSSTATCP